LAVDCRTSTEKVTGKIGETANDQTNFKAEGGR